MLFFLVYSPSQKQESLGENALPKCTVFVSLHFILGSLINSLVSATIVKLMNDRIKMVQGLREKIKAEKASSKNILLLLPLAGYHVLLQ